MSTIIKLRCVDQVLTFDSTPLIASGDVEVDRVEVDFCPKWNGMVKTATFWRNEEDAYHVILDEYDSCAIPPEVLIDEGSIYLGFFGVSADGRQRTSQVLRYNVVKGAITTDAAPDAPTADIYTQLLAKYLEMVQIATDTKTEAQESQEAFEQKVEADQAAFRQEIEELIAAGLLPDGSVATAKLKDEAVTAAKLGSGAVTTAKLQNGAVTEAKLATAINQLIHETDENVQNLWGYCWQEKPFTSNITRGTVSSVRLTAYGNSNYTFTGAYSDSFYMDESGKLQLLNPTAFSSTYSNFGASLFNQMLGKYMMIDAHSSVPVSSGVVYYVPADATYSKGKVDNYPYCVSATLSRISSSITYGEADYTFSENIDAHTHTSGGKEVRSQTDTQIKGYEYEFFGSPVKNSMAYYQLNSEAVLNALLGLEG